MNNKIKLFFKPTFFKIILAIIILCLPLIGKMFYSRSITFDKATLAETTLGIKIVYYISNTLAFPTRIITTPFQNFFGENYINCSITKSCPIYIDLLLFLGIFLILIVESYLLSCLIIFLLLKLNIKL